MEAWSMPLWVDMTARYQECREIVVRLHLSCSCTQWPGVWQIQKDFRQVRYEPQGKDYKALFRSGTKSWQFLRVVVANIWKLVRSMCTMTPVSIKKDNTYSMLGTLCMSSFTATPLVDPPIIIRSPCQQWYYFWMSLYHRRKKTFTWSNYLWQLFNCRIPSVYAGFRRHVLFPIAVTVAAWREVSNGLPACEGFPLSTLSFSASRADKGTIFKKATSRAKCVGLQREHSIFIVDDIIFYWECTLSRVESRFIPFG